MIIIILILIVTFILEFVNIVYYNHNGEIITVVLRMINVSLNITLIVRFTLKVIKITYITHTVNSDRHSYFKCNKHKILCSHYYKDPHC